MQSAAPVAAATRPPSPTKSRSATPRPAQPPSAQSTQVHLAAGSAPLAAAKYMQLPLGMPGSQTLPCVPLQSAATIAAALAFPSITAAPQVSSLQCGCCSGARRAPA